jgi:hypothetical protein
MAAFNACLRLLGVGVRFLDLAPQAVLELVMLPKQLLLDLDDHVGIAPGPYAAMSAVHLVTGAIGQGQLDRGPRRHAAPGRVRRARATGNQPQE